MAKIFNLEVINISTTAHDLEIVFKNQFNSHMIYKDWQPNKKIKEKNIIRKIFKKMIPKYFLDIYSFYNLGKEYNNTSDFIYNKDNQWLIRGIFKKKRI